SLSPQRLGFAAQDTGSTSAAQVVTLTNSGTANLSVTAVSVTGPNAGDFTKTADSCGGVVIPGAICSVSVAFSPTAVGTRSGSLTFTDNASDSPQSAAMSGT